MPAPAKLRPQLSPDLVVEAAAKVLERDGIDGLTMRAVAAELKVKRRPSTGTSPTRTPCRWRCSIT
uniref:TetR family transcriptional regulator n=1 Tax=Phenylobacterium glaciei TaxID=2803784 RepID=A0A974P3E0_9CAUL|nr:TetR family transcriptional regulator [Phenylobacterium glaciei]